MENDNDRFKALNDYAKRSQQTLDQFIIMDTVFKALDISATYEAIEEFKQNNKDQPY